MAEQTPEQKVETAVEAAKAKVSAAEAEASNKVAIASAQASFDALIIESLRDIRSGVSRVEEKTDRTNERMDTLVNTTNHRLDDFRLSMDAHATEFRTSIGKKVDKTDLLTSVGFKLGNMKFVRWGLGLAFTATVGTAAAQHWWGEITSLFGF